MKIVKTDFVVYGVMTIEKGWIYKDWLGDEKRWRNILIDPSGQLKELPYDEIRYNNEGKLRGEKGSQNFYLNNLLQRTNKEKAEQEFFRKKYLTRTICNFNTPNDLICEFIGIKFNQFGFIIKSIEDNIIKTIVMDQTDIFEKDNLERNEVCQLISKDQLTIMLYKHACRNFILLDNPLL